MKPRASKQWYPGCWAVERSAPHMFGLIPLKALDGPYTFNLGTWNSAWSGRWTISPWSVSMFVLGEGTSWVNYTDLTSRPQKWWLVRGIIPFMAELFRSVKYSNKSNLPRYQWYPTSTFEPNWSSLTLRWGITGAWGTGDFGEREEQIQLPVWKLS